MRAIDTASFGRDGIAAEGWRLMRDFFGIGWGMNDDPKDETYSEEETVARREAALKRMLATPHKPQKESQKGARRP
jgi:hypothetical protein